MRYMFGGDLFGARAYANNFSEEELLEAIDYAHLFGRKVYLTVNTLLKNAELTRKLYDYILPFYRRGLDAVLVQDMGVLKAVREWFPDLPVHATASLFGKADSNASQEDIAKGVFIPLSLLPPAEPKKGVASA